MKRIPWPPVVYVVAIALAVVLDRLYSLPWFGSPLADILVAFGWLGVAAVAALFVSAFRIMRRTGTTIDPRGTPEHLVTGGPFALSRNPIYVADTLLLISVGLISGIAWFVLLAFVAAFAVQKVAIEPEERILATRFGKRFRDYAKRVRRWI